MSDAQTFRNAADALIAECTLIEAGVYGTWRYNKHLLVRVISELNREAIETWQKSMAAALQEWQPINGQYFGLHLVINPGFGFTPHVLNIVRRTADQSVLLDGRSAYVLPKSIFFRLAQQFLNTLYPKQRRWQLFTDLNVALAWLDEGIQMACHAKQ